MAEAPLISALSLGSLAFVALLVLGGWVLNAHLTHVAERSGVVRTRKAHWAGLWYSFDALTHLVLEASFVYWSLAGRTVAHAAAFATGPLAFTAQMWSDYARADTRWAHADPTIVSVELITVLGAGPLALLTAYLFARGKAGPAHFCNLVLGTGEIYGCWMTFAPEWLLGSPSLPPRSDVLLFWIYLVLMNAIWVIVPAALMYDSYRVLSAALPGPHVSSEALPEKKDD